MASHHTPPGSWSDLEDNPLLREDAFQNEHSRSLFDAIDRLRGCGANQDIELPELVIVGDQSAGKSSLLQSLTDIPFPVASNVCTRFPTRIISRRIPGKRETTTVSIEPRAFSVFGSKDLEPRRARYDTFKRTLPAMTKADFLDVIKDASDAMGIRQETSTQAVSSTQFPAGESNFSDDVLKIEISGPDRSYFSILDVPGIFQSLTRQLTKTDKSGVESMVSSYLIPRQSIVICVASATNDPANQAIFDMVSRADAQGERTVGVITKCDVTQHKEQVMDLAKNKEKHFHHGWFVVRNRTPAEVEDNIGPLERYNREREFFNKGPWNELPEERRGTQALKKYLAELLCTRIQKAFPTFLRDIQARRDVTAAELKGMGAARRTIEQKRSYLTRIAHDYHSLAVQGLEGRYDHMAKNDMKLRMRIREANDSFTTEMRRNGHSAPFVEQSDLNTNAKRRSATNSGFGYTNGDPSHRDSIGLSQAAPLGTGHSPSSTNNASGKVCLSCPGTKRLPFQAPQSEDLATVWQSIPVMKFYEDYSFEELRLSDYVQAQSPSSTPNQPSVDLFANIEASSGQRKLSNGKSSLFTLGYGDASSPVHGTSSSNLFLDQVTPTIYRWIRNEIKSSRGTELQGTVNPYVLPILFHKQAEKWGMLSDHHFHNVRKVAIAAMNQVLSVVCKDSFTYKEIEFRTRKANNKISDRFTTQLVGRLEGISCSHLQTNNPAFEQKISEARRLRFHAALERYRSSRAPRTAMNGAESATDYQLVIDMRDTAALFAELHMSNSQNLEDEIHDTLKAYYELARDDFVEYVNQLIVEPYLNDLEGPVRFFSPLYVAGLKDEEVEALGAEDEGLMRRRVKLEETLARLTQAEEIAREYD